MKEIKISRGLTTMVDDEDYEFVSQFKWFASRSGDTKHNHNLRYYAYCKTTKAKNRTCFSLHGLLAKPKKGEQVHHINGDSLDNRKSNLKCCSPTENHRGVKLKKWNATSRYRGVYRHSDDKKWVAQVTVKGVPKYLGAFDCQEDAAKKYDEYVIGNFGEFATPNFNIRKEGGDFYTSQKTTQVKEGEEIV